MAATSEGTVKSYGLQKGYGFITSEEAPGQELYFPRNALPPELREMYQQREPGDLRLPGRRVTFVLSRGPSGQPQAAQVRLLAAPGLELVGKVRSYCNTRGFGFLASSSLDGQDIFFARKEVPLSLQHSCLDGATAKFRLHYTSDGKPQASQMTLGIPAAGITKPTLAVGKDLWEPRVGAQTGAGSARSVTVEQDKAMHGIVKSYDANKGFGFILCNEVHRDIYFKGQGYSFAAGTPVTFHLTIMQDGKPQARDVAAGLCEGATSLGTVKSYNARKGFGFVQVPDSPGDIYFKKDLLPPFWQQDENFAGKTVQITVHLTRDGKPQVQSLDVVDAAPVFVDPLPALTNLAAAFSNRAAPSCSVGWDEVYSRGGQTTALPRYGLNCGRIPVSECQ